MPKYNINRVLKCYFKYRKFAMPIKEVYVNNANVKKIECEIVYKDDFVERLYLSRKDIHRLKDLGLRFVLSKLENRHNSGVQSMD